MILTRADVVAETLSWVGTPYRHQHSTKGQGCDCLGLIRGVYRALIGPEPEEAPNYSPSWGEVARREVLLGTAQRHLIQLDKGTAQSGDVVIFRMRRGTIAKHCAIVTGPSRMVHAYEGAKSVTESRMTDYWARRIAGEFSLPGVS